MATYTSNYGWTKPSGSDNVDISVLNNNLDDQDSTIHDAFLNMAPPFSESSTYAVDDIVLYETGLYKCHTAVVTPGSWTGSTNWQVYKLSEGGGGGTSDYSALNNKPKINGVELAGNKTTGDLNIDYNDLKNKPTIPSAQVQSDWNQTDSSKADYIKNKPALGTAAAKSVPVSGDAGSGEVVMGNDSRLSDSRPASDVSSWAKQATKPTYTASEVGAIPSTDKGANGGVAELDSNGKVPSSQLPSYVDDVLSYASQSAFPATGETGKIYIAEDTNKTYRWSGSAYTEISASLALGETSSTAYRGDRGKTAYDHSQTTGNPHGTTASDVGLGNVPNVSTNDQKPTFTKASTRNNIASGEKLSVILGKVQKFFNDLKTVAFSGSYTDLSNKPSIPTKTSDLTNDSNFVSDANYVHTDNNFTASEKTKLAGIASGAEANVQANWSQTNTSADDFIKNKPSLATVATSGSYNDLSNKPTIPTSASGITYDNTASGLSATDVQGAVDEVVGKMGNMRMTKLWENPDPTSSFAEQDINLSSDDYDMLFVLALFHPTINRCVSLIVDKGKGVYLNCSGFSSSTHIYTMYRTIAYANDTKLRAYSGYISGTAAVTAANVDNERLIPYQIYGIKLTASVKINAIAMDVSTSADKCMLSDGVTSVKDAIECTQTTAGNYRLRATVSAGGAVTYSWVAE